MHRKRRPWKRLVAGFAMLLVTGLLMPGLYDCIKHRFNLFERTPPATTAQYQSTAWDEVQDKAVANKTDRAIDMLLRQDGAGQDTPGEAQP